PGLTSAELGLLLGQAPALVPGGGEGLRPPADRELPACRARSARGAVVTGDDLHRSVADALAAAGSVVSPLEQGLTRVVVGRRLIAAGALRAGEQHLRAAAGLFEGCGADALAGLARAGHPPLATLTAVGAPAVAPAWAEPLTEREREVARVIAAGASNRLAARQLLVSSRTIEVHLTNIFRKLGVRSRMELALLVTRSDD
ncbi:MAG: helix-turn-helix transcriptional regulator, partial [Actinotalea sp.]|nr:helix-turn-helix transcriptional regulator [Actinotalea sp.]